MEQARKYLDKKYLFPLFAGFFFFLFIKFFLFDIAVIKSPSMQPVLQVGDWVFIKRIFTPKRNDIVQIALPLSEKDSSQQKMKVYKRISGMPGDTVSVINSRIYVNGRLAPENKLFLHNYIVKIKTQRDSFLFHETGVGEKYLIDDSCAYMLVLNDAKFDELQEGKKFNSLLSNSEDPGLFDESVFPFNPQVKWNKDFFGPLYIPRAGDELKLDTNTIKIYGRIISNLEGNTLEVVKNKILINGKESAGYIVKKNYYFVTGDNFDSSIDSRHWGFIPENKLKAKLVGRDPGN